MYTISGGRKAVRAIVLGEIDHQIGAGRGAVAARRDASAMCRLKIVDCVGTSDAIPIRDSVYCTCWKMQYRAEIQA